MRVVAWCVCAVRLHPEGPPRPISEPAVPPSPTVHHPRVLSGRTDPPSPSSAQLPAPNSIFCTGLWLAAAWSHQPRSSTKVTAPPRLARGTQRARPPRCVPRTLPQPLGAGPALGFPPCPSIHPMPGCAKHVGCVMRSSCQGAAVPPPATAAVTSGRSHIKISPSELPRAAEGVGLLPEGKGGGMTCRAQKQRGSSRVKLYN